MLGATVIAVFFIPLFYYLLESMSSRKSGPKEEPGPGVGGVAGPMPPTGGSGTPKATPSKQHEGD
jgi:multidrug efflux pump